MQEEDSGNAVRRHHIVRGHRSFTIAVTVIGDPRTWPAKLCAMTGKVSFTPEEHEPGLVALLDTVALAGCFPFRVVEMMLPDHTGKLHLVKIEPHGLLRHMPEVGVTSITLNLGGFWYDPDMLPEVLNIDRAPAISFPTPQDLPRYLPAGMDLGKAPRKGIIKDAYVFDGPLRRNPCSTKKLYTCETFEGNDERISKQCRDLCRGTLRLGDGNSHQALGCERDCVQLSLSGGCGRYAHCSLGHPCACALTLL